MIPLAPSGLLARGATDVPHDRVFWGVGVIALVALDCALQAFDFTTHHFLSEVSTIWRGGINR